ncbi:MAG TPA: DUF3828 domain-containing protein [Pyrinomonadaceae bacterium]|nr:DUF3828 domain-containing protein [Pyrinomonadaceae bacterium]
MKNKAKLISFALLLFFIGSLGASTAEAQTTPEQTVKTFYEWYVKELNREGGNPIDNKQMLAKYVSSRVIKQINAWRAAEEYDADYFINAQDFDESWRVSTTKAVITGNTATLKVMLKSSKPKNQGFSQNLVVKLIKANNAWKIDNVE